MNMAVTNITKQKLGINGFQNVSFTALTSTTDGFVFEWDVKDERAVILVQNEGSSGATITILAGNGLQGVNDLAAYSVGADEIAAIVLDSGAFKNVTGESKGYVKAKGSATGLKAALIELY